MGVQPQLLWWKHDGRAVNFSDPRICLPEGGGLIIRHIEPSDAGIYALSASNGAQCQSVQFVVSVECELATRRLT